MALFFGVWYLIWLFLECLGLMGTGFKLLGGKDSAKLFDVVDNPISGLMIGILSTVLVQSSSTTTSIIIGLVGADEMSVSTAIPMVMGANIGTSVTNTLVAMGHFANKDELRRGFAGATVHDCFNLLSVAIQLPLQWASDFLGEMSYEMAKGAEVRDILQPAYSFDSPNSPPTFLQEEHADFPPLLCTPDSTSSGHKLTAIHMYVVAVLR